MPVCTVKSFICSTVNCRGKLVILQSKLRIFGKHLIFEFTIIIWSSIDHDPTRIAQKSSRCKSYYFWKVEKLTVLWQRHNSFMGYQKNSIQSSFWRERHFLQLIFILQVQEMLSQKVINVHTMGNFQKSTKRDFKSKAITWDW